MIDPFRHLPARVIQAGIVLAAFAGFGVNAEKAHLLGVETVLELPPGAGNPRNSEGDFAVGADGTLYFIYTHFTGSGSDFGAAHLAARVSSDRGITWSDTDRVVVEKEGEMNSMSVSCLRLQGGELALFYLRKNSKADCRPYLRVSGDEGTTWSEPRLCIDPSGYFVVNNDRVIQLTSGRLLIPTARHSLPGEDFRQRGDALCYLSDDEGLTWFASDTILSAPADSTSGLQEPAVVELSGGRLMMLCRTDQGCQMRSYSFDKGITWTDVQATRILSPVSPASIERVPGTNHLLMVWNDHRDIDPAIKGKRTPLCAAISEDEGDTWARTYVLEDNPDGWYCYTAVHFVGDYVLLGYCAGDTTIEGGLSRTRLVRFPVDSLYR